MKLVILISALLALITSVAASAIPAAPATGQHDDAPALSPRHTDSIVEICEDADFGGNCLGYDTDTLELGVCIYLDLLAYTVTSIEVYEGFYCKFMIAENCAENHKYDQNYDSKVPNVDWRFNDQFASFKCELA